MLEYYIRDRKKLAAMDCNLLAPFLKEAAERFRIDGYDDRYARTALERAASFGGWLRTHRVPLDRITGDHVSRFLDWFAPRLPAVGEWRRKGAYSAAHFVLALIRHKHPAVLTHNFVQQEVVRYGEHLRCDRGLAEGTLHMRQRDLEQFLTHCFRQRRVDTKAITAARIHEYVHGLPYRSKQRSTCTSLRGYLRFLQLQGVTTGYLLTVVPTVRSPRKALPPKWLTSADGERLLGGLDVSRATGKRDYAVILCMIELGMRVGDVARLSLDDIDWREGTVRVPNHKRARPYQLPLPQRLGEALTDYLAHGRPASQRREIFLCHAHPRGMATTVAALKQMVQRTWQKTGLEQHFSGTHILRHSVATRLKQEGVSLKFIADVLGHHSVQTTALYAQVDLPTLRTVAQPWPEVQS